MAFDQSAATAVAVAFACGLLLGIERERRRGDRHGRHHAGVRSFALTALIGALAQLAGGALVLAGAVLVILLGVSARWRDRSAPARGLATELALFLCYLLGVVAVGNPALAGGVAVLVAVTLNLRDVLHQFARRTLRPGELRDGLLFAAAVLIVRPLLPDAGPDWLPGIDLRALWTLVVVLMGIQAAAHIALRLLGPRLGLAASGLASGFISGVATIAAMGARSRHEAALGPACLAGAAISNISTYVLLWIVVLTVAPAALGVMAPMLGFGTAAAVAVALYGVFRLPPAPAEALPEAPVFRFSQALVFALGFSAASAAVSFANAHLGAGAAIASTALAGFFDVHAATGSALGIFVNAGATVQATQLAVLLAISCNMASKLAGALAGGPGFVLRIGIRLGLILLATWLPYILAR